MRVGLAVVVVAVVACGRDRADERPAAPQVQKAVDAPAAPQPKPLRDSKLRKTKLKLTQYANEAFPSWAVSHPDKACPDRLADLNEYMNSNDTDDAWGRPLKMMCGASLPPGAKGLAVLSRGEDGKEGTADDIKSWE